MTNEMKEILDELAEVIEECENDKDSALQKIELIKASEVLAMNLKALDATATAFCLANNMPIRVFGLKDPADILKAVKGESVGTIITAE